MSKSIKALFKKVILLFIVYPTVYTYSVILRNIDTSTSDTIESTRTQLRTLIVASIHTLKRGNKKCGNDEVFQLVSESLENEINRKFFEEILETLIQKQRVKANRYGNRTCLSIPKEDQTNKAKANDTDNLNGDFINFKTQSIKQFETMKSSFLPR